MISGQLKIGTLGHAQRGVVILLALIMLVSMTLAGIALYRQMGTGLIIARNLTFRRTAAVAADLGVETARTWIAPTDASTKSLREVELQSTQQTAGSKFFYYPAWCYGTALSSRESSGLPLNCSNTLSSAAADFNPLTYDWTHSAVATLDDGAGNEIRYVIHRLCGLPGSLNILETPNQRCAIESVPPAGQTQNVAGYGQTGLPFVSMPYYRITTRVQDRTNTRVYTQAIIY